MDLQRGKTNHARSSTHTFVVENNNVKDNVLPRTFLQHIDDKGENSGRNKYQACDGVDNIIQKYKDQKLKNTPSKYSDQKLNSTLGELAFFNDGENEWNGEFTKSVQNFYNYCEPKYFPISSNKDNHGSAITSNFIKLNPILNENMQPKVAFIERNNSTHKNMEFCKQTGLTSRDKFYADKTTYCRPVISLYNEDFIYNTMERNSRLKKLVKKLAIARQREKQNVNWNNYINNLKNKHVPSCNASCQWTYSPQFEPGKYIIPDIIDDYYDTRFSWQQSRPCRNLLHDLYGGYYAPPHPTYYKGRRAHDQLYSNRYSLPYDTDSYCYPTASQRRLNMLEQEKRNKFTNQRYNCLSNDNFKYENNYVNKNDYERHVAEKPNLKSSFMLNNNKNISDSNIKSCAIKTDKFRENINKNKIRNKTNNVLIDELIQTSESNKIIVDSGGIVNPISLVNIENKLETLIDCINNFIDEIKLNRKSKRKTKPVSVTCDLNNFTNKKINTTNGDIIQMIKTARKDSLVSDEILNDSSESTIAASNFYPCAVPKLSEIDKILKEIDKFSSKDTLFKSQPCSVNVTFEVPTRDCSTEVTKSLSKQHTDATAEIIEEIRTAEHTPMQQMTIAVNTDPLNFLSLLRISTDALMRLLSHMPNINYHSYLAFLSFPQMTRKVESHYICNICGAAFNKPSALSDHIKEHTLGKTRDCCVCRHVLDASRRLPSLFKCKFCGQRFTRAYCRELHQQSCAQVVGQTPDVASSLMLLR